MVGLRTPILALCLLAACAQGPTPAAGRGQEARAAGAMMDTLRGRIEIVGSEPATSVALMSADGRAVMLVAGEPMDLTLRSLSALEVTVWGESADPPRPFRVEQVIVRTHMGEPVVDGVLVREGGQWYLVTAEGDRHTVATLPVALLGHEGHRVWMSRGPDGWTGTFGLIR